MSKKRQQRKEARIEREAEAAKKQSAPAEPTASLEEANTKLAETSRVIDMKKAAEKVQSKIPIGGIKKSHQGRQPAWASSNPKLPPASKLPPLQRTRLPKPKPLVECECGCGGKTKSRFVPGHDSYLRAVVMRVEREVMSLEEVEKLCGKGQRAAVEKVMAENKKQRRAEDKSEKPAKVAKAKSAKAEAVPPPVEVAEEVDAALTH